MWENFKTRSDRNIGPVVGATMIIMLGGFCILVIGTLTSSGSAETPALIAISFVLGSLFVLWLLRDRPRSSMRERFSWIGSKRHREGIPEYEPQILRDRPVRYGTKRPPTLDEVRELKDSPTNWVPSQAVSGRKSVRRR